MVKLHIVLIINQFKYNSGWAAAQVQKIFPSLLKTSLNAILTTTEVTMSRLIRSQVLIKSEDCPLFLLLLQNRFVFLSLLQPIARTSGNITWRRGDLIQRSDNSKVYQGFNINSGQIITIKTVHLRGSIKQIASDISALKEEISLLRDLKHPNIVRYLCVGIAPDKKAVDILQEYVPGGSIRNLLDRFGPLDEKIVKIYTKQILEGLKYLHSKGIVHRNLKCSNILVDNDATVKLSDFGASKRISFSDSHKKSQAESVATVESVTRAGFSESLKASPYWMAPEVINNTKHHKAADIWSVGCVMLEMRTGTPPWAEYGKDPIKVLSAITKSKTGPIIPKGIFSHAALACIRRCFAKRPEDRPTAEQLLNDLFLTNQNSESDTQARQIVQQMSTRLQQENQAKASQDDRKLKSNNKDDELSLNSSDLDSIEFDESLEPVKKGTGLAIIHTKPAAEPEEKARSEQEKTAKLKEERRKKWEEALLKEIEQLNKDKK